jgi:hypothetical protein
MLGPCSKLHPLSFALCGAVTVPGGTSAQWSAQSNLSLCREKEGHWMYATELLRGERGGLRRAFWGVCSKAGKLPKLDDSWVWT